MSEPVKVLPMAQLLRLAREKEARERALRFLQKQRAGFANLLLAAQSDEHALRNRRKQF